MSPCGFVDSVTFSGFGDACRLGAVACAGSCLIGCFSAASWHEHANKTYTATATIDVPLNIRLQNVNKIRTFDSLNELCSRVSVTKGQRTEVPTALNRSYWSALVWLDVKKPHSFVPFPTTRKQVQRLSQIMLNCSRKIRIHGITKGISESSKYMENMTLIVWNNGSSALFTRSLITAGRQQMLHSSPTPMTVR